VTVIEGIVIKVTAKVVAAKVVTRIVVVVTKTMTGMIVVKSAVVVARTRSVSDAPGPVTGSVVVRPWVGAAVVEEEGADAASHAARSESYSRTPSLR